MTTDLLGKTLDKKYLVTELLGHGGMGAVYKGTHLHLQRDCAIKVILKKHAADPIALKRFQLEAQAASMLEHPNIIKIYDSGVTDDELAYIVMEFLHGDSLDNLIRRHKFIHYEMAIPMFMKACDALAHAHSKKVLHRDLKPGNIMILNPESEEFDLKLLDFGIAKLLPGTGRTVDKLTETGEIFGSPMYMSPEQCMGQALDQRSDIYAFGCVMYETLTGQVPFVGDTFIQVVLQHINEPPRFFSNIAPDIAIPEALENIILQCLCKERALRFDSVSEIRKALAGIYTSRQFKGQTLPGAAVDDDTSGGTVKFSRETLHESKNQQNHEKRLLVKIQQIEARDGKKSKLLVAPLSELYLFYNRNSEYEKALQAKERELGILEAHNEGESLEAAYCRRDAGLMQMELRNGAAAEAQFRESLSLFINILGTDDLESCRARIDLANALRLRNRMSEAIELVESAVSKITRNVGGINLDTAEIEMMAGDLYYYARKYEEAYQHFLSACFINKQILGEKHSKIRNCLMDMARSQYFSGKDEKAIEHAKEAIEVANANPDDFGIVFEHPWAILSWAYQNLSMFEDAKQACLKRLEILESLPGEYSLQMAGALRNFADICDKTNEPEKAKQCRAKADLLNPERTETC
jgi:serine/threonine protein kinase